MNFKQTMKSYKISQISQKYLCKKVANFFGREQNCDKQYCNDLKSRGPLGLDF